MAPNIETCNATVYAAIVTGTAALLGVLIGALLQYFFFKRELSWKRSQAINAATLFIGELLGVFNEFNNKERIHGINTLGMSMPIFLQEQLSVLNTSISEFEPQMAIDLLWVKQASSNVDLYLKKVRTIAEANQFDKNISPILGMALVDVGNAIKYSKRLLIRGYNAANKKTRNELWEKDAVRQWLLEEYSKRCRFTKCLIRHGLKKI